VLVAKGGSDVTLLGRHEHKMDLVKGLARKVVVDQDAEAVAAAGPADGSSILKGTAEALAQQLSGAFDACVEASGSSTGIRLALAITRPLGTIILKTTVSLKDPNMPGWSEIANDTVVNEKVGLTHICAHNP
jgi:threonine dehydrogenase-like Zn-dependent dehydrogenase